MLCLRRSPRDGGASGGVRRRRQTRSRNGIRRSPGQRQAPRKSELPLSLPAAVVVIFVVFSLFGGRGDKATAEQFFDAVFDGDAAAIVDLVPRGWSTR